MLPVLTAAQMRELDRRTIEAGIPETVLMENAAQRVVEFLRERYAPLDEKQFVVLCGKGNNGGDGFAIARILHAVCGVRKLDVVVAGEPPSNHAMLSAAGVSWTPDVPRDVRPPAIVIDALLGTGISGAATGRVLDLIHAVKEHLSFADVIAVDLPSGMPSDSAEPTGEFLRAKATVTFTALKVAHALPPNCDSMGEIRIGKIGTRDEWIESELLLLDRTIFKGTLGPRPRAAHKGTFGHVLVIGGAKGKTGAAAMAGLAALRAGAGLVTVACDDAAGLAPELMSSPLPGDTAGKTVIAAGPGLGSDERARQIVRNLLDHTAQPLILDADALNVLAGTAWQGRGLTVITPHPGEAARLLGEPIKDRVSAARKLAAVHNVVTILKGQRSLIAFPDGRVWINPTGTPAMATGGSGDILTGLIAGWIAQFHHPADAARAVYLHGLAGEKAASALGEKTVIATDLLRFLPDALHDLQD